MFKALAEAWYWDPERVSKLTPQQLILLSGKQAKAGGDGKLIDVTSLSDYEHWRSVWMKENSEEALLGKAEKRFTQELARMGALELAGIL